ncbi:DUF4145 domain-containing protein [Halorubrum saccharovorum]|uniref:DUF4145 domain-containing protein n=1 Tax=Halorubrum saccharovorum TaxID=2248 RepID=UPI00128C36D6|nr:DUF4145 domain-containing protein [Halorubrum saccharovorum]
MDGNDSLEPRNSVDILLNHQTQRLEDIANNAVDFIRINLIILGAFVPFLSVVITDFVSPELFVESRFADYIIVSWIASTLVATFVYRFARTRSMSHFDMLEQAVVNDWREADLRDEMIDNNDRYDRLSSLLMICMTISIALSIMTILFIGLGLSDLLFGFTRETENTYLILVMAIGVTVGVGIELLEFGINVMNLLLIGSQKVAHYTSVWAARATSRIKKESNIFPVVSITTDLLKFVLNSITDIFSFVNQSANVVLRTSREKSEAYEDYAGVFESRNISPIRIRLLRAIQEVMGLESWKFNELSDSLGEEFPDIGVTRGMINRLQDEGYITQVSPSGPSTLLVREQQNEVISPDNLQEAIESEVERMVEYIEDKRDLADIVVDEFGVTPEDLEDEISDEESIDQLDKLNAVVDRIRDEKEVDELPFGKVQFIQRANKFRLTPKALQPFMISQLEEGKQALEEGYEIQAVLLASRELELYLKSIALKQEIINEEEVSRMSIGNLIEILRNNNYISQKEFENISDLQSIRNRAAHSSNEQLESKEIPELLSFVEDFIRSHI